MNKIKVKIHIKNRWPPKINYIKGTAYKSYPSASEYSDEFAKKVRHLNDIEPWQLYDLFREGLILEQFDIENPDKIEVEKDENNDCWIAIHKDIFIIRIKTLFDNQEDQIQLENLRKKTRAQARELTIKDRALHEKNIALDAMHYVWCSGGCESGMHRYDKKGPEAITDEIIKEAIRNTERLISAHKSFKWRKQWEIADPDIKADYFENKRKLKELENELKELMPAKKLNNLLK